MPCERKHVEAMEAAFWELVYAPESQPKLDAAVDARDAAYAACDESPWRSMESAPGHGTVVLLYAPSYARRVVEAHQSINGKWWTMNGNHVQFPTHWMPLPAAPEGE